MRNEYIKIQGARTNNLKNITVNIPKHQITVATGVSGAGKSSLIFSTLAATSQRQVNKTYSAYVQQLLPQYPVPDVDRIENLPFSIVVTQRAISGNIRSTVGTFTDIYTALRLLFSRMAKPFIGYSMVYSFNNTEGMCPRCEGLGIVTSIKAAALLNKNKSLNGGAIQFPTFQPGGWRLSRYTESGFFDNDLPLKDWDDKAIHLLLNGESQKPQRPTPKWPKTAKYLGLIPRIEDAFIKQDANKYQSDIKRITETERCPACEGTRLNQKVLLAKINGKNIADCSAMSMTVLKQWLATINIASLQPILSELDTKISHLMTVGLDYLSLNRTTSSLSGGESQRLKLANYLNSELNDILYIFDEPSVGLHPHDLIGINKIFKLLKEKGNTLVIVDHDPQIIETADYIINLGERAGNQGGYVTFQGNYHDLVKSDTLTGKALRNSGEITTTHGSVSDFYALEHVSKNNLNDVSVKIPRQRLSVISGVAGSGKSTLIQCFKDKFKQTTILDQKQVHASERSNMLTYLGLFDDLRQIFANATHQSMSLFSFNSKGACPVCKGKGVIKLDLAYMGDTVTICDACNGQRYSPEVRELKYRGFSIAEVLQLTPASIAETYPELKQPMMMLIQLELGYLQVGQSLNTLSGGELQRLKLAKFLFNRSSEHDLLILDEPTSGLHESNIQHLIHLLKQLTNEAGLTVIVVEHNLRLMGQADWLIDIGPFAGMNGGNIMFEGTPEKLIKAGDTLTARAMRKYFKV